MNSCKIVLAISMLNAFSFLLNILCGSNIIACACLITSIVYLYAYKRMKANNE